MTGAGCAVAVSVIALFGFAYAWYDWVTTPAAEVDEAPPPAWHDWANPDPSCGYRELKPGDQPVKPVCTCASPSDVLVAHQRMFVAVLGDEIRLTLCAIGCGHLDVDGIYEISPLGTIVGGDADGPIVSDPVVADRLRRLCQLRCLYRDLVGDQSHISHGLCSN